MKTRAIKRPKEPVRSEYETAAAAEIKNIFFKLLLIIIARSSVRFVKRRVFTFKPNCARVYAKSTW